MQELIKPGMGQHWKSPAFDARTLGMSNLIIFYNLINIWLLLLIDLDISRTILPKTAVPYPWIWLLYLVSINSACRLPYIITDPLHVCILAIKLDSYFVRALSHVYAHIRWTVLTPSVQFYACMRAYVRRRVLPSWTFKAGVDISSSQMRFRGSRSTNGYRRHVNLHAYTRVCSYLKFTKHLRGAILAIGVAQRGAYARWWSQKVWIQLYTASINCCKGTFYCNDSKIMEFEMIDTKNSSTAYVVMYKLIT